MEERYPNLKEEVGGLIPNSEISYLEHGRANRLKFMLDSVIGEI